MWLQYMMAMQYEGQARDEYVQGSLFLAKSSLTTAIAAFKWLEQNLRRSRLNPTGANVGRPRSNLAKRARKRQYVSPDTTDADILRSIQAGLASSQYHMAHLLALDGKMDKAIAMLAMSEQDSKDAVEAFDLVSSDELPCENQLMERISTWESNSTDLKKTILSGTTNRNVFGGDNAFISMCCNSQQAWRAVKDGNLDTAVSSMRSSQFLADELLPEKTLDHTLASQLQSFKWPQTGLAVNRDSQLKSMQHEQLVKLSSLWKADMSLVDVLHDKSRAHRMRAERVRLALLQQVTSRLACLLFVIAQNKNNAPCDEWRAWCRFKQSPAFKIFSIIDRRGWEESHLQAVCDSVFGFCFEHRPLSFDALPTNVNRLTGANDWRWLLLNLRSMQQPGGEPLGNSPARWATLARGILDFHSASLKRQDKQITLLPKH